MKPVESQRQQVGPRRIIVDAVRIMMGGVTPNGRNRSRAENATKSQRQHHCRQRDGCRPEPIATAQRAAPPSRGRRRGPCRHEPSSIQFSSPGARLEYQARRSQGSTARPGTPSGHGEAATSLLGSGKALRANAPHKNRRLVVNTDPAAAPASTAEPIRPVPHCARWSSKSASFATNPRNGGRPMARGGAGRDDEQRRLTGPARRVCECPGCLSSDQITPTTMNRAAANKGGAHSIREPGQHQVPTAAAHHDGDEAQLVDCAERQISLRVVLVHRAPPGHQHGEQTQPDDGQPPSGGESSEPRCQPRDQVHTCLDHRRGVQIRAHRGGAAMAPGNQKWKGDRRLDSAPTRSAPRSRPLRAVRRRGHQLRQQVGLMRCPRPRCRQSIARPPEGRHQQGLHGGPPTGGPLRSGRPRAAPATTSAPRRDRAAACCRR